jgi:ATP synthase in type III secretion protein N
VLHSASRVMPRLIGEDHADAALAARRLLDKYREVELLVQLGEYRAGQDALADAALACHAPLRTHLQQRPGALEPLAASIDSLRRAVATPVPAVAAAPEKASAVARGQAR